FFQAEDGIRDRNVTGVQTCALPISLGFHGWSLFVAGGVACLWLLLYISIARRRNVLKALTQQVVAVCALGVLWDLCTGWRAWSKIGRASCRDSVCDWMRIEVTEVVT